MNQRVKYTSKQLLLVFAILAFAQKGSFAESILYTSSFSTPSSTFTTPFYLQQFDPALGTLTSLSITLLANVNGTAQIMNQNSTAQTYSVVVSSALALLDPQNITLATATPRFASSVRVAGGGGYSIGASSSDSQVNSYTTGVTLSEFIGVANFTGTLTGSDLSGVSGPGHSIFSSSATTNGSIGITYTYSLNPPLPATAQESPTLFFALFGVSGLIFLKVRST